MGECRVLGWFVNGFIFVEEVVGKEFVEVYHAASLRNRRRLIWVHGELMGALHQRGVGSKVYPKDLICISQNYTTFPKCLVAIDPERGRTRPVKLSIKDRGKMFADIWIKGAFTIGRGERSELMAFLSGYFAASGRQELIKAMREDLVNGAVGRAVEILAKDDRFACLRQDFKERYGIARK